MKVMKTNSLLVQGKHVRLKPLERCDAEGLAAAAVADPSLYQWSPVPQGETEARKYVRRRIDMERRGYYRTVRDHAGGRCHRRWVDTLLEPGTMVICAAPRFAPPQLAGHLGD